MLIPTLPLLEFAVPAPFERAVELAYNLWWAWNPAGHSFWSNLDPVGWERSHNPLEVLSSLDRARWHELEQVEAVQERYRSAVIELDRYMADGDTWYVRFSNPLEGPVAYLCSEFGAHDSIPFYSGGLGILAGDHLKSASDLGVPMIGVGLLYRRGYFRQEIEAEGEQQHFYPTLDLRRLPVLPVASPAGGQLKVEVELPGRLVQVGVWKMQIGKTPLLLLDTDNNDNDPADRPITHTLYVRGREMRLCQELVLGVGAVRALTALGVAPAVWHVNEGHAALSFLERAVRLVEQGALPSIAQGEIRRSSVFTLHTPVPAGNEGFDSELASRYLAPWAERMGLGWEGLSGLATVNGDTDRFDLGALAIRMSGVVNGVSKKHAEVVTRDWEHLLGGPALAITNGVHTPSWVGKEGGRLLVGAFGRRWPITLIEEEGLVERVRELPDEEIWRMHQARKEILSRFARGRLRRQFARHGESPDELRAVDEMLSPDWLTLGFARRFATYKRATLAFSDPSRMREILCDANRPVQIIFAGKAHPADRQGQSYIKQIFEMSRSPELRGHLFMLEDYDSRVARFMVQGVDVWVNTPRPPMEASGTSGMKAAVNGILNLSILDGWWAEGYNGKNGWAFGSTVEATDEEAQDLADAASFYEVLSQEVVPLFYERGADGIPAGWIDRMRESIVSTLAAFSSHRMLDEYYRDAYLALASELG